jgi:hypothetical protein
MARKKGFNSLSGSIGDITYVQHPLYGQLARKKAGPSKEQINNSPSFEKLRKNMNVFGGTSRACGLIRKGFLPVIEYAADKQVNNRLMPPGRAIYKEGLPLDTDHPFHSQLITRLKGFQLNSNTGVHDVFRGDIKVTVTPGQMNVQIGKGSIKDVAAASH